MDKSELLRWQIAQSLEWYNRSEEKAKFLVSIDTAVVSVVSGLIFVGADDAAFASVPLGGAAGGLLLALSLALVSSLACILHVLWARQNVRDADLPDKERLLFFGDVASLTREAYADAVSSLTAASMPAQLEAMLVSQNHILARNVLRKHRALNWAIAFTLAAVVLLLAFGYVYALNVLRAGG